MEIVGPILLILILLVGFGKMAGIDSSRVISTYVNLLFQLLVAIGEILAKVAIPLIKHGGEKIVYIANQYLEESKKNKPPKINEGSSTPPDFSAFNPNKPSTGGPSPAPAQSNEQGQQQQTHSQPIHEKPKPKSANPYDDPPEPEIMD